MHVLLKVKKKKKKIDRLIIEKHFYIPVTEEHTHTCICYNKVLKRCCYLLHKITNNSFVYHFEFTTF